MEQISESAIPKDPAETEERFRTAKTGDIVTVYVRAGAEEYYLLEDVTITSTQQSQTEDDDVVWGERENGTAVTMLLKWNPKEPNVGIARPYPEGPITITIADESFEVTSIQTQSSH